MIFHELFVWLLLPVLRLSWHLYHGEQPLLVRSSLGLRLLSAEPCLDLT